MTIYSDFVFLQLFTVKSTFLPHDHGHNVTVPLSYRGYPDSSPYLTALKAKTLISPRNAL